MPEERFDNLPAKTVFFASATPQDQKFVLKQIRGHARFESSKTNDVEAPFGDRELSPVEETTVSSLIATAGQKLESLGVKDAHTLLPIRKQIAIRYQSSWGMVSNEGSGLTGPNGEFIEWSIPETMQTTEPKAVSKLFHELSHFVTQRVIKLKKKGSKVTRFSSQSIGFLRDREDTLRFGKRGPFEEGPAELFTLYCFDNKDAQISTVYRLQVPFTIAWLTKFAEKRNITPMEAFAKFYTAKTHQDYSFYKDLVDVFGVDMVRKLNNVRIRQSEIIKPEELDEVAKLGEFGKEYEGLLSDLDQGHGISFPGMRGTIVRMEECAE